MQSALSPWLPSGKFNVLSRFTLILEALKGPEHQRGALWPSVPSISHIGLLTEPPRAGISNSRIAWAQDTSQSYRPSRFTMTSGRCQARTLSLLWSKASAPSPSTPNLFPLPASTMSSLAPHSASLSLWGKLPSPHSVPQFTEAPLDLTFGWGNTSTSWGKWGEDPVMMMMAANFFNVPGSVLNVPQKSAHLTLIMNL